MRRILILLFAATLFAGCEDPGPPRRTGPATHTLVMYLVGNNSSNDLSSFLRANMEDALEGLSADVPGDGRIIAFYRPMKIGDHLPCVYELRYDRKQGAVQELLWSYEADMVATDPASMRRVLTDIRTRVPSGSYGLVLGSHASGWFTRACRFFGTPRSASAGAGALPADLWEQKGEITRTFGNDAAGSDEQGRKGLEMNMSDLVSAFDGAHYEYIIFDACFMASVEALYDLRASADYIVASPTEIMGRGMPYSDVLPYLFDGSARRTGLEKLCRGFVDYFSRIPHPGRPSGTISLVDCAQLEALAGSVRRIALRADAEQVLAQSRVQAFEGMRVHVFYDLDHTLDLAAADRAAYEAFRTQLARTVLYAGHTTSFYSTYNDDLNPIERFSGLTTYIPFARYPLFASQWAETAWAQAVTAP